MLSTAFSTSVHRPSIDSFASASPKGEAVEGLSETAQMADKAPSKKQASKAPPSKILCIRDSDADFKARQKKRDAAQKRKDAKQLAATKSSKSKQKQGTSDISLKQTLAVKKKRKRDDASVKKLLSDGEDNDQDSEEKETKSKKPEKYILICFDLGTTYSGFAWALSDWDPSKIKVNKGWPGSSGSFEKVPTTFARVQENQMLSKDVWGYRVAPNLEAFSWFKLLVAVDGNPDVFDDPLLRQEVGLNLTRLPEDADYHNVISYFYSCLRAHAIEILETHFTKDFIDATPIKFIITIPAEWGDEDKRWAYRMAMDAGVGSSDGDTLEMITEPEAAAITAVSESIEDEKGNSPFKCQTSTIIVDLGGGTTDLKCYTIVKPTPLRLTDACVGQGGYCGATSIYRAFVQWLKDIFGDAFTSLPAIATRAGSSCHKGFEELVKAFDGNDGLVGFTVPLILLKAELEKLTRTHDKYDFSEGCVRFNCDEMKFFFKVVVEKMCELIKAQLAAVEMEKAPKITTLVACGGLANCAYVVAVLKDFCRNHPQGDIAVKVPTSPWAAIARGGVLYLLQPHIIEARKSRFGYAIEVSHRFQKGIDKEADRYKDPIRGDRAKGYAHWMVRKGEQIAQGKEKTLPTSFGLGALQEFGDVKVGLYRYDGYEPPERIDVQGVEKLGTIAFRYQRTRQSFRDKMKAKDVDIIVVGSLAKDTGLLDFKMKYRGRVIGEGTVEYDTMMDDE